jgi:hypothetical protein
MKEIEPLLDQKDLRKIIPISRRELGRWVDEGCPSIKKGRRRLFKASTVFYWLKAKGHFQGDWVPES